MEEKLIVVAIGAITTIAGAVKSYYDYKAKAKNEKEKNDEDDEDIVGTAIEKLFDDFKTDQIVILKIEKAGKYATSDKIIVTHEKPKNGSFKSLDTDSFKEIIKHMKKNGVLSLEKVYEVKHQTIKELLFKHSFISCYAFKIDTTSALFMLYTEGTFLSNFDKNDIIDLIDSIKKDL